MRPSAYRHIAYTDSFELEKLRHYSKNDLEYHSCSINIGEIALFDQHMTTSICLYRTASYAVYSHDVIIILPICLFFSYLMYRRAELTVKVARGH